MPMRSITLITGLSLIMLMGGCPMPATNTNTDGDTNTDPNVTDPNENNANQTLSRVYGDGSAGSRVISEDLRLGDQGDVNLQYVDFTIEPNVTLTVQSGTVIRCTGTFTNNGSIVVQNGAEGGTRRETGSSAISRTARVPVAGISTLSASVGEVTPVRLAVFGGDGGIGLSEFESRSVSPIVSVSSVAFGGGGAAAVGAGGDGGGAFTILAAQPITNDGSINADGESAPDGGGGGGGGGGIVLASAVRVINTSVASISANGGNGGAATSQAAPGGGGGGGIVHMIAPEVDNNGGTSVGNGAAGADGGANSITNDTRAAGGGGGASAGNGGNGGDIGEGVNPTPGSGTDGTSGFSLETLVDPTALF